MKWPNRLTQSALILLLFLLSGSSLQSLAQQDSTKLSLYELKLQAALNTELEFRRKQASQHKLQLQIQDGIIEYKDMQINTLETKIENQNKIIEEVKPAWYDRFWIGTGTTAFILAIIFILIK